ncbi:DMT family transporter [Paenibacillus beijingensis]|uniref:DMT family transporter n=1 Tax=Paenibacillus beijingensis TaxID=1126833 RepID=UPI000A72126A|nr:DMT family transporter [Paenibacillus beijingensis]
MAKLNKSIYLIPVMVIISWGLNVVMVKFLTQNIQPMHAAAIRMLCAGIALLPFVWKKYGFYKPNAKQWGLLLLIGLCMIALHQALLAYGVVSTSAANASLILGLNPLTTALLASIFIGETFTLKLFAGILLGFSGVVLVVLNGSDPSVGFSGSGDFIMVLSMLAYVAGGLFIKKITATSIPTLVVTAYSTLIGAVLLNIGTVVYFGPASYAGQHFSPAIWTVMLLSAWVATSLGTLGWSYSIKMLGVSRTAMFLNGLPFTSMIGGYLFLHEKLGWIHAAAFILTTLGIIIGTVKFRRLNAATVKGRSVNS